MKGAHVTRSRRASVPTSSASSTADATGAARASRSRATRAGASLSTCPATSGAATTTLVLVAPALVLLVLGAVCPQTASSTCLTAGTAAATSSSGPTSTAGGPQASARGPQRRRRDSSSPDDESSASESSSTTSSSASSSAHQLSSGLRHVKTMLYQGNSSQVAETYDQEFRRKHGAWIDRLFPPSKHLYILTPEDDISNAMFRNWVPRWMDPCNLRPDPNGTVYNLKLEPGVDYSRKRRSIDGGGGEEDAPVRSSRPRQKASGSQVYGLQEGGKGALMFKGGAGARSGHRGQHLAPKQTTFRLSPMSRGALAPRGRSKVRFFVANGGGPEEGSRDTGSKQEKVTVKEVADVLWLLDTHMHWLLLGTLTVIKRAQNQTKLLHDAIEAANLLPRSGPDVSPERRAQIIAQRKWLPKIEDFVLRDDSPSSLYNISGGLHHTRVVTILQALYQHLEFFAVAFEQFSYDQRYLEENWNFKLWEYDDLYLTIQRLLCNFLTYGEYLIEWKSIMHLFNTTTNNVMPKALDGPRLFQIFWNRFSNGRLERDRPFNSKLKLEAPINRTYLALPEKMKAKVLYRVATFLPENRPKPYKEGEYVPPSALLPPKTFRPVNWPTNLWREVMPLEQRQLRTLKERRVRDQAIIAELLPTLNILEMLVQHNII